MNRNRKINTDLFKIQIYIESKIEKEEQGSEESQIELLQPINSLWSIIRASQMGPHGNHKCIIKLSYELSYELKKEKQII